MQKANILSGISAVNLDLIFAKNNKALLDEFIDKINSAGQPISPQPIDIFNAFKITKKINVVIVGQDPYPSVESAMGLSFSVPFGRPIPPSLKNIYRSLQWNGLMGNIAPVHGNLEYWAKQNVLLLNMALTTIKGKSNAHPFWNEFVSNIIQKLDQRGSAAPVFILWGKFAQKQGALIKRGPVLTWGHPSPLNAKNRDPNNKENFLYCDNFKRCNEIVSPPIDWNINGGDLWAATDGSAIKNGKRGCRAGWGFILRVRGKVIARKCGEVKPIDLGGGRPFKSSNNRGELTAIIEMAAEINNMGAAAHKYISLNIITDSKYSIGALPDFVKRIGMAPQRQNAKENKDLIDELGAQFEKMRPLLKIFVYHVAGHSRPPKKDTDDYFKWEMQDESDKLATSIFK